MSLIISSARCSSVVQRPYMVRWALGSITRDGPIELFLVLASTVRLLSCLWEGVYIK